MARQKVTTTTKKIKISYRPKTKKKSKNTK